VFPLDEKFLAALDRIEEAGGVAVGFDRLLMLLTGAETIAEVTALSRRRGVPGRAEGAVIAFRFLRTVLGWAWIFADTMVSATAIGISGETGFSEAPVLRAWARRFLRVAGARVIVRREAELEPDRSYIFVSNHTSNLDVAAILSVNDHPMRFIAKKELKWIPLFGWAARRMGHVFIDRKDRAARPRPSGSGIGRGLRARRCSSSPKGRDRWPTSCCRSRKVQRSAALETHLDCVPIAVAGARAVLKPKGLSLFQPGTVAVVFGEPIPSSSHALDRRDELVAEQRTAVENALRRARRSSPGSRGKRLGPPSGVPAEDARFARSSLSLAIAVSNMSISNRRRWRSSLLISQRPTCACRTRGSLVAASRARSMSASSSTRRSAGGSD